MPSETIHTFPREPADGTSASTIPMAKAAYVLYPSCGHQRSHRAPSWIRGILAGVRLMGAAPLSGTLRFAWDDSAKMRAALAKQEA